MWLAGDMAGGEANVTSGRDLGGVTGGGDSTIHRKVSKRLVYQVISLGFIAIKVRDTSNP